jgi:hypothetical protein
MYIFNWINCNLPKVDCWGKGLRVCFEQFEDFEFRATFTDRKNTPTFAASWNFILFYTKMSFKLNPQIFQQTISLFPEQTTLLPLDHCLINSINSHPRKISTHHLRPKCMSD